MAPIKDPDELTSGTPEAPRVPKEPRDSETQAEDADAYPGYLDEEELHQHPDVADVVGTTELPCGISDTEYPCGVMSDEDADSSGGASDSDQGY